MNNNYDRGEDAPKTYDEMVAAGYEMTGDGFWLPRDEDSPEVVGDVREVHNVKLLLLKSGENVLANVTEQMYSDEVILHDPKLVTLELSASTIESTIGYSDWQPLSKSRTLAVKKEYIVSMMEPLDELGKSYEAQVNG